MATTKDIIIGKLDHMNLNFIHKYFTISRVLHRNVGSRESKVFQFAHVHAYIYIFIYINTSVMMHYTFHKSRNSRL